MNVRDELELLERLANEQGLMLSDELINFAERVGDTMTNSHPVQMQDNPGETIKRPTITVAKLNTLYTAGMHLAHAMRQVGDAEAANDLEIWVLGMKHDLEQLMENHND